MKKNEHQVLEHLPGLRRYAYALCGCRYPVDPEDLVQECLARAIAKFSQWQPDTDLRAWLFTIMHNLFLNMLRKAASELRPVPGDGIEPAAADTTVPEIDDLEKALRQLSPDQRSILMLVTLEGLSYQQVADMLKVPVGTVMSRLSRARQRLRDILYPEDHSNSGNNVRYLK